MCTILARQAEEQPNVRYPFFDLWASFTGRLYLVIGVLIVVLAGTSLQGVFYNLDVAASTRRLAATSLEAVRAVDDFDGILDRHRRVFAAAIEAGGGGALRSARVELRQTEQEFDEVRDKLVQADPEVLHQLSRRVDELSATASTALDAALQGNDPREAADNARYKELIAAIEDDVAAWKTRMRALTANELLRVGNAASHEEKIHALTTVSAVVVGLAAMLIARSLLRRMRLLTSAMLSLAVGDLTTEVPFLDSRDEVGTLASALEVFRSDAVMRRQIKANQRTTIEHMSAAIVVISPDRRVVLFNQKAATLLGLSQPGSSCADLSRYLVAAGNWPAEQVKTLDDRLYATRVAGGVDSFDIDLPDGRSFTVNAATLPDSNFLVCFENVTERRSSAARIHHLAHYDALTDLPNRTLFQERLGAAVEHALHDEGLTVTMLMLDLDRFKEVNDTYGHPAGDELLRQVATRISATMRKMDTLARLGGDEFAIIHLTGADPRDAHALADRILAALKAPFDVLDTSVSVGVSIGIAQAPLHAGSLQELMIRADLALYAAKREGRHCYAVYCPEMAGQLEERRAIETELRKAVEDGALELHYQPQVELNTRAITGVEALARWRHPTRGDVPPSVFIPIAEETGLIVALGAWVLARACQDAASWDAGLMLAVNVSPRQLQEPDFTQLVDEALQRSGLPATRLELEITESAMLADGPKMLAVLDLLRSKGIRLALDDFGTGYSALSYLQKFPFDRIKIDRTFVRELGLQADSEAIIRAVAGLGLSLGIPTIAEGIETEWQAAMVREAACQDGQGYLFSRPVPAIEITALLAEQKRAACQPEEPATA